MELILQPSRSAWVSVEQYRVSKLSRVWKARTGHERKDPASDIRRDRTHLKKRRRCSHGAASL